MSYFKHNVNVDDFDENETIIENMKALVEKERMLAQLQVVEKEKQLLELSTKYDDLLRSKEQKQTDSLLGSTTNVRRRTRDDDDDGEARAHGTESKHGVTSHRQRQTPNVASIFANRKASLSNLASLNFSNSGLNEQDVRIIALQLRFLPGITKLVLRGNDLTDSAAASLVLLVKEKSRLLHLDLSCNDIELDGAMMFLKALRSNTVLNYLDISDNPFGAAPNSGKYVGDLLKESTSLETLKITISEIRRDRHAGGNNSNTAKFMQALYKHKTVVNLHLNYAALPANTISVLCKTDLFGSLVDLDLRFAYIGHTGASILARQLIAREGKLAQDKDEMDGQPLLRQPRNEGTGLRLRSLNLMCNAIGMLGCKSICKALSASTTLDSVNLAHNDLDASSLRYVKAALKRNVTIKVLDLSRNRFARSMHDQEFVQAVRAHPSLVSLGHAQFLDFDASTKAALMQTLQGGASFYPEDFNGYKLLMGAHNPVLHSVDEEGHSLPSNHVARTRNFMVGHAFQVSYRLLAQHLTLVSSNRPTPVSILVCFSINQSPRIGWKLVQSRRGGEILVHEMDDRTYASNNPQYDAEGMVTALVERCLPNDEFHLSFNSTTVNQVHLEELSVYLLPDGQQIDEAERVTNGLQCMLFSNPWDRRERTDRLGFAEMNYTVHLHQVSCDGIGQVALQWESQVEAVSGDMLVQEQLASSEANDPTWQVYLNNQAVPVYQSTMPSDATSTKQLQSGFFQHTVMFKQGQVMIGDVIVLHLHAESITGSSLQIHTRNLCGYVHIHEDGATQTTSKSVVQHNEVYNH